MKSFEFDIAIIGGGCVGSSIFYALTRRGFSNVGLIDQGRNTVSATASSGGMLRVFHEDAKHVDLALANLSALDLHQREGVLSENWIANGSMYFFAQSRYQNFAVNLQKMDEAGYPFEVLTPSCGRNRFPMFQWRAGEWAIYEPRGTQLSPRIFVDDLISASTRGGATLVDDFAVHRISRYCDQYRVSGDKGTVTTKTLILAGGARLLPRLRDLGLRLPLEARLLSTFKAEKIAADLMLPNYFDRETLNFGRFGCGPQVVVSDPGDQRLVTKPWHGPLEQISAEDCYAPNRQGFSGQVPGFPRLILAAGWGGTGFKFALEVGNRVANAVEQDQPERRMSHAQF